MTKTPTTDAIQALRIESDMHDDAATVALCDRALAGDATALASVAKIVKGAKPTKREMRAPRRSPWAPSAAKLHAMHAAQETAEDLGTCEG